ncbi:unnamed protein product [Ambrosiozyma monospora]|uniref:Unnamed protein product n=2 Tax=Ambrosiozyma monospora TaxID=43982 RepID=A0ACB5UAS5_AMBMO|nr:unnamed protein product [Ambrosiozyma monospora]
MQPMTIPAIAPPESDFLWCVGEEEREVEEEGVEEAAMVWVAIDVVSTITDVSVLPGEMEDVVVDDVVGSGVEELEDEDVVDVVEEDDVVDVVEDDEEEVVDELDDVVSEEDVDDVVVVVELEELVVLELELELVLEEVVSVELELVLSSELVVFA